MTKKGADLTTFGQEKKGADLTKKGADLTNNRTGVRQCLQVSERDRKGSEVKWVMAGYCEHCDTTLEELYTERIVYINSKAR